MYMYMYSTKHLQTLHRWTQIGIQDGVSFGPVLLVCGSSTRILPLCPGRSRSSEFRNTGVVEHSTWLCFLQSLCMHILVYDLHLQYTCIHYMDVVFAGHSSPCFLREKESSLVRPVQAEIMQATIARSVLRTFTVCASPGMCTCIVCPRNML